MSEQNKISFWKNPDFLLRIGIAFTFLYAGVSSLIEPSDWIWYVPDFTDKVIPKEISLFLFSIAEVILGVWLISGWKTKFAALISTLILGGITLLSLNAFQITFRDVGLVLAALALFSISKK